jgi:pyrroloquinoline quinone biosynthesis protein B
MQLFDSLPVAERQKIWFIHFNHTNPLLNKQLKALDSLTQKGYHIAEAGLRFKL